MARPADRTKLTAEEAALAAAHLPLARSRARRDAAGDCRYLRDELESAYALALVTAARAYGRRGRGAFATFALNEFRAARLAVFEAEAPRGYRRHAGERHPCCPARVVPLDAAPPPPAPDDPGEGPDLSRLLAVLTPRQFDAIEAVYWRGENPTARGADALLDAHRRGLAKLRAAAAADRSLTPGRDL